MQRGITQVHTNADEVVGIAMDLREGSLHDLITGMKAAGHVCACLPCYCRPHPATAGSTLLLPTPPCYCYLLMMPPMTLKC